MKNKLRIGITVGDLNGVGLEVVLKSLENPTILDHFVPVIYGSGKVVSYHKNVLPDSHFQFQNLRSAERLSYDKINIVNCWQDTINLNLGQSDNSIAKYPIISLKQAVHDHKQGLIDCIVTAPIDKNNMKAAGFEYPGHTEYFGAEYDAQPIMIMATDRLRVALVTSHVPLSEVASSLSKARIAERLRAFDKALKKDFGIDRPNIAVLGANPHAGDNGMLGHEEDEVIRPVVIEAKKKGIMALGPYSADGFFASGNYTQFDGVLAMYHDQGLIPFKVIADGKGVNVTSGLGLIRTSPDHGTAFNIAGKGEARHHSFLQALFLAKDIYKSRKLYDEDNADVLEKTPKPSEGNNA